MKLYRGLKSVEFKYFSEKVQGELNQTWAKILSRRSKGDWSYPKNLDNEILSTEKLLRLERQHFTDQKSIALNYAKTFNGVIIEIDIPIKDILKNFRVEFQNFGKRKTKFEIVYVVDATLLYRNRKKWKVKILSLGKI